MMKIGNVTALPSVCRHHITNTSERPSTSSGNENIDRVRPLVLSDRRLTVRMIAKELGLGKSSVHTILTEHLEMKKVCAKIVQKLL
jgi:hypothetical protein